MAAVLDGTNGLTFNDNTRMGSANSLGMRNALFNADFRINQRGYVSAATLAAGAYGHDRFKAGASGGDYSFTQLNSSTQVTIASGKSLIQVVEDKNVVGGSYVLSWTGTALARVGVNSATPSGTFVVSPILIAGQTAGTTMSVEFNAGTLATAQLELGTVATPFERRPIGLELALCQRYYETSYPVGVVAGTVTLTGAIGRYTDSSGNYCGVNFNFTNSMRAAPSVTSYGVLAGGTSGQVSGDSTNKSGTVVFIGTTGAFINCANVASSSGESVRFHYTANAEL